MRLFHKASGLLAATFVLALATSVGAAPQRGGGGGHSGGGHMGGGHAGGGGQHGPGSGGPHGPGSGGPHGPGGGGEHHNPGNGGPHGHDGGPRGHFHGHYGHIVVGGGFYDPFWGPYYPYGYDYPYGYGYPYLPYDYSASDGGSVKTEVTPKETEVFVDGYYAGVADDFDGTFQRLHAATGGHAITLHLEGYRTVTQNVYVRPDSTVKVTETMEKLAPGEVSKPVPIPAPPAGRSEGMTPTPDGGSAPQQ